MTDLRKPGLVIHAFFVARHVRETDSPARKLVVAMWDRVQQDLEMRAPGSGAWPTDLQLDTISPTSGVLTVLAMAQREVVDEIHEALAYQLHDVLGISILIGSGDTRPAAWPQAANGFFDDWSKWTEGVLGAATVYVGLTTDPGHAETWTTAPEWAADVVLNQTPPEWCRNWWRPVEELVLWELAVPPPAHSVLTRRLLAIAALSDEAVTEDWFWSNSQRPQALPPFTSYLIHAAKVRYERVIVDESLDEVEKLSTQVDYRSDVLGTVLKREKRSIGDILEADRALNHLRWRTDGLSETIARVREMTQTVRVAESNMKSSLEGSRSGQAGSPVEIDRQLSRWTRQQLRVLHAYLDTTQRRAVELQRFAAVEISAALQDRRESLVVLQTAVIGAIVMALAAIQSFQYTLDWLPVGLQAPTIFLLAALALMLPSAVLRWPRGGGADPALALFDIISAGILGSVIGWFLVSLVAHISVDGSAPLWVYVLVSAVLALAAVLTTLSRLQHNTKADSTRD